MDHLDIDALSDEMKEVRETVHRFSAEVLRPAAAELDRHADPADTIAEGSVLWDRVRQATSSSGSATPAKYGPGPDTRRPRAAARGGARGAEPGETSGSAISLGLCDTIAPWAQGFGRHGGLRVLQQAGGHRLPGPHRARHGSDHVGLHRARSSAIPRSGRLPGPPGGRRVRDQRPEGGLGLERPDRDGGRPLLHPGGLEGWPEGGRPSWSPWSCRASAAASPLDKIGQRTLQPGRALLRRRAGSRGVHADRGARCLRDGLGDGAQDGELGHGSAVRRRGARRLRSTPSPTRRSASRAAFPSSSIRA